MPGGMVQCWLNKGIPPSYCARIDPEQEMKSDKNSSSVSPGAARQGKALQLGSQKRFKTRISKSEVETLNEHV